MVKSIILLLQNDMVIRWLWFGSATFAQS